jgi:hypothetical protein
MLTKKSPLWVGRFIAYQVIGFSSYRQGQIFGDKLFEEVALPEQFGLTHF